MFLQTSTYTLLLTPAHMRAAYDALDAPIEILHDDPLFDCPATLRLSADEARALAARLIEMADAA